MASRQHKSGGTGNNSTLAIIALIVLATQVDTTWATIFLGAIVAYGLIKDWVNKE
ncbi:hypothetical protein [Bifidobacterium myosotis]|uniref:hypothetical protein n=1 Tax=Bifidobacterium myosotis TaxID=1630166 RepID=UPI00168B4C34|nr:hypothetical protein [Bifidobacterium myosotis]